MCASLESNLLKQAIVTMINDNRGREKPDDARPRDIPPRVRKLTLKDLGTVQRFRFDMK